MKERTWNESLNTDGAMAGVDHDSRMGSGRRVKARHYLPCEALADRIREEYAAAPRDEEFLIRGHAVSKTLRWTAPR